MNKKLLTYTLAAIVSLGLAACDTPPPQRVNPTYGGPNGECVEADGEPCDDDPFDLDDLYESKKSAKPTPKVVVPPKPPQPVRTQGGTTVVTPRRK